MAVKRESLGHRDLDDDQSRHSGCWPSGWASRSVVNIVKPPVTATNIDVGNFDLKAPKAGDAAGGGGGGGSHDIVDPIEGQAARRA